MHDRNDTNTKFHTEKRTQPRMALDLAEPKARISCTFKLNSAFHVRSIQNNDNARKMEADTSSNVEKRNGSELVRKNNKDCQSKKNVRKVEDNSVTACNGEVLVEKMDTGKNMTTQSNGS